MVGGNGSGGSNVEMVPGAVWQAIDAQRTAVADLLADLSAEEWRLPSLCEGWTVRDVAGHLTLQQVGVTTILTELFLRGWRLRGMNQVLHDTACRAAAQPTERIIAKIRSMRGSRRHNIGVSHRETLIDILVHSQDISIPVGRRLAIPPGVAAFAASRIWSKDFMFHARRRFGELRFIATDVTWTVGRGASVQAPISAILLVLTGRSVDLPLFTGEGREKLRALLGG